MFLSALRFLVFISAIIFQPPLSHGYSNAAYNPSQTYGSAVNPYNQGYNSWNPYAAQPAYQQPNYQYPTQQQYQNPYQYQAYSPNISPLSSSLNSSSPTVQQPLPQSPQFQYPTQTYSQKFPASQQNHLPQAPNHMSPFLQAPNQPQFASSYPVQPPPAPIQQHGVNPQMGTAPYQYTGMQSALPISTPTPLNSPYQPQTLFKPPQQQSIQTTAPQVEEPQHKRKSKYRKKHRKYDDNDDDDEDNEDEEFEDDADDRYVSGSRRILQAPRYVARDPRNHLMAMRGSQSQMMRQPTSRGVFNPPQMGAIPGHQNQQGYVKYNGKIYRLVNRNGQQIATVRCM